MNGDRHTQILESYFWRFLDQGDPSAATPLFIGIYEGYPLSQLSLTDLVFNSGSRIRHRHCPEEVAL
jgi:hypothetical protein